MAAATQTTASIEMVMRRRSAYTGRVKDSSTHTPEKGNDGRADAWMRKRRVQTGSKSGRAREEESEVDRRWLPAESLAAGASQGKALKKATSFLTLQRCGTPQPKGSPEGKFTC